MKIISEGKHIDGTEHTLIFRVKGQKGGSYYSFECDEHGNAFPRKNPAAQANYDRCMAGFDERTGEILVNCGANSRDFSYYQSPVGLCDCGEKIHLANFTNTCECGIDYNSSGQQLAPREQWGSETGEHWSECY